MSSIGFFNKPLAASINTTPNVSPAFPINIGQPVRLMFQQPYNGSTTGSQFATMAAAQTVATWTTMLAATDGTAIHITPLFSNSKIEGGKPLQTAADSNLTYRGQPEFFGIGGSMMTFEFREKDAISLASLSGLPAFSQQDAFGISNLSAYIVTDTGDVMAKGTQVTTTITLIEPINIFNFWFSSHETEGFASGTNSKGGLWLPPGWSDNLVFIPKTATFDPRLF